MPNDRLLSMRWLLLLLLRYWLLRRWANNVVIAPGSDAGVVQRTCDAHTAAAACGGKGTGGNASLVNKKVTTFLYQVNRKIKLALFQ